MAGPWPLRSRGPRARRPGLQPQDPKSPWIGSPGRVLVLVTPCERAVWLTHSKSSATSNSSTRSAQSSVESRASSVVLASSWCLTARNTRDEFLAEQLARSGERRWVLRRLGSVSVGGVGMPLTAAHWQIGRAHV